MTFQGRHAIVTGAGSGTGLRTAADLVAAGAAVTAMDTKPRPAELDESGCVYERLDVTDRGAVQAAIQRAYQRHGRLDHVVNVTTAHGWQAAVSTLAALRQTVHALRGWPTPYGIAMNIESGLCSFDGRLLDERADESVGIVASQIMQFMTAFRDAPAAGALELRACPAH